MAGLLPVRFVVSAVMMLMMLMMVPPVAGVPGYYLTEEDHEAAAAAAEKIDAHCSGWKGSVDVEKARQALKDNIGGANVMLDILEATSDPSDLRETIQKTFSPFWFFKKTVPLVMSVLVLGFWLLFCWTCWPCCRCCRMCLEQERRTSVLVKALLVAVGIGLMCGVFFAASMASAGYVRILDGIGNVMCTSAKFVGTTLVGRKDPYFVGMVDMLQTLSDIDDALNHTSPFVTQVLGVVDGEATAELTDALAVSSGVLQVLKDTVGPNIPAGVGDRLHECMLCTELAPSVDDAITLINDGVEAALDAARAELAEHLSPERTAELQASIRTLAEPLIEIKNSLRTLFGTFLDADEFLQVQKWLTRYGPVWCGILTLVILAMCLIVCMAPSLSYFVLCERYSKPRYLKDGSRVYYRAVPHRCAACTWCCGCFYAMLAFLLGGVLVALSVPLSGTCLILDTFDSQILRRLAAPLGVDMSSNVGVMLGDLIDECFVADNPNKSLLDIVFTFDQDTGEKVTLRAKIDETISGELLDRLDTIFNVSSTNMSAVVDIVNLREVLRLNTVDTMILPFNLTSATLGLLADPRGQDGLPGMFATTGMSCADRNITGAFFDGVPYPVEINGLHSFAAVNRDLVGNYHSSDNVSCTGGTPARLADCGTDDVCQAGNRFLALKQELRDLVYKCSAWEGSNGTDRCDIKDMFLGPDGWEEDCLKENGTLVRREDSCADFDVFVDYVANFDTRIGKALSRLDAASANAQRSIRVNLQRLLNETLLLPIQSVTDGLDCGYLGEFYNELIHGLCYQSAWGVSSVGNSYVICAGLVFVTTLLMYAIWCRAINNFNSTSTSPHSVVRASLA